MILSLVYNPRIIQELATFSSKSNYDIKTCDYFFHFVINGSEICSMYILGRPRLPALPAAATKLSSRVQASLDQYWHVK